MNLIPVSETRKRRGGVSVMTDWRHREAGLLPKPVKINGRNLDVEDEIDQIQRAVVAGATEEEIKALVVRLEADRKAGVDFGKVA